MIRMHACTRSACYEKVHNVQQKTKIKQRRLLKLLDDVLKRTERLMTIKNVLMKEYQDLNAIEKNQPQKEGYYMPHHAVIQKHAGKPSIDRKNGPALVLLPIPLKCDALSY